MGSILDPARTVRSFPSNNAGLVSRTLFTNTRTPGQLPGVISIFVEELVKEFYDFYARLSTSSTRWDFRALCRRNKMKTAGKKKTEIENTRLHLFPYVRGIQKLELFPFRFVSVIFHFISFCFIFFSFFLISENTGNSCVRETVAAHARPI